MRAPTTFTSSSGNGSAHATRLVTPGFPLKRVAESCPISASFAISAAERAALLSQRDGLRRVLPEIGTALEQRRADLERRGHRVRDRLPQLVR